MLAVFSVVVAVKGVLQARSLRSAPVDEVAQPSSVTSGEEPNVAEIAVLEHDVHDDGLQEIATTGKAGSGKSLVIVVVSLGVGLFVSRWLGMIIALTLAVFSTLFLAERKSLVVSTVVSLAIGAVIYFIFVKFLQIPLPWGVINRYLPASVVS